MQQKVPPHNNEAEQSVLGSLMLNESAWDEVADSLREDDFYRPGHRLIFKAMNDLKRKNLPTDIITISNQLLEKNELEAVGGPSYLNEILDIVPSTVHLHAHLKIVLDKSVLRKVIEMSDGFLKKAYSQDFEDVDSYLDSIEADVFKLSESKNVSGLVDASELVRLSISRIEEMAANKLNVTGLASGFTELDDMTAGFQPGEMTILAARPSMGKTALSLNIALHAAVVEKKKVAYFSVEMGKESVMMRVLASSAKVKLGDIKTGQIDQKGWVRLIERAAQISESGLFIDDTAGISPFEIRAKCRRLKAKEGLDLIMVDYLQLMGLKQKVDSREREVSEISKLLKSIAKELRVPVIALAQLNRGVESRHDKRPMLSDLRESGSIEQDADIIMMIYREDYYDRENPDIKGISEIIIAKQRNGPTGAIKLKWRPDYGIFENLAAGPEAPLPTDPRPPQFQANSSQYQGNKNNGNSNLHSLHPNHRRPPNLAPGSA